MLGPAGRVDAIDGNLDLLVDDRIGIIRRIDCRAGLADEPRFHHCEAELCDPGALGGWTCRPTARAAAIAPGTAVAEAAVAAVSNYAAALYDRAALPLATFAEAPFACARPADFALFSDDQYAAAGFPYVPATDRTPLRWASAIDLASGATVHVPAAMVFHPFVYLRLAGDKPIAPPGAAGLACAAGAAEAAFSGLCDVICQDAMALFWQAMTSPPQVTRQGISPGLADMIRRFEASGDSVVLLDIATDNAVPAFAAVLCSDQPEAAVAKALKRLASTRRQLTGGPNGDEPPTPDDGWRDMVGPLDHLLIAADHGNRSAFDFAIGSEIRRELNEYEPRGGGSIEADLDTIVRLVETTGHQVYLVDLTPADIAALGLSACRVVVPGYHALHATYRLRALGGDRLYEAPQRLGYRGINRGGPDNPLPHPFAL
jgi:ribosomal protein S12 methylthiotransferase accessory factor